MVKTWVWMWFTTYCLQINIDNKQNPLVYPFWKSQHGRRDLEGTSNTFKTSILPSIFLFLPPFYSLLFASLDRKQSIKAPEMGLTAIFILCWFLSISHLFSEDKTCLFLTPIPFFSIFSSTSPSIYFFFHPIIPPSLPPPSFHPPHGREHRTDQTWRLHLGPAGRLRWRTAPPGWRSAEVRHCASGPQWLSLECRPWSEVTTDPPGRKKSQRNKRNKCSFHTRPHTIPHWPNMCAP